MSQTLVTPKTMGMSHFMAMSKTLGMKRTLVMQKTLGNTLGMSQFLVMSKTMVMPQTLITSKTLVSIVCRLRIQTWWFGCTEMKRLTIGTAWLVRTEKTIQICLSEDILTFTSGYLYDLNGVSCQNLWDHSN